MAEVSLHINGKKYSGWEEVTINRGYDVVASGFSFSASDKIVNSKAAALIKQIEDFPINEGDSFKILMNGNIQITQGWIDTISPAFDGESHTLSVSGRSVGCDLVDCSADYSPGEWKNITFINLVKMLCKPYGITDITSEVKSDLLLPLVRVQHGESNWDLIERMQKKLGVAVNDNYRGGLVIREPTRIHRADVALVQGKNIKAGSGSRSQNERFSQYKVKGQMFGDDLLGADVAATSIESTVFDRNIKRYRPKVILAEGSFTNERAKVRAAFEMNTAAGKSNPLSITVRGWIQNPNVKNPREWQPNLLVKVYSPWLRCDGRELMISRVSLKKNEAGEISTLDILPLEAFRQLPELSEEDGWSQLLSNTK